MATTEKEEQLREFLKKCELESCFETFQRQHIDLTSLPDLTDEHLKELGLTLGHRLKLKKVLSEQSLINSQEGDTSSNQDKEQKQKENQPTTSSNSSQPSQDKSQIQSPTRNSMKISPPSSSSPPPKSTADPKKQVSPSNSKTELVTNPEKMREYVIKVIVVGEIGTGKTSLIQRYTSGLFDKGYKATIGVDFCLKELQFDDTKMVSLQLWDIAGQERFANLTRMYYKEARGAFVVFDLTRFKTYEAALKWKQDIDSKVTLPNGKVIPVVLLANKCDAVGTGPDDWTKTLNLEKFCQDNGFLKGFYTSAKEDIGISDAANYLVKEILETDELKSSSLNYEKSGLNVKGGKTNDPNKSGPCCF